MLRCIRCKSGRCPVKVKDHRSLTDIYRISTGNVTHEFQTNSIVTDIDRTSNGCLSPFCPVESFEHVQNFRTDGTDIIHFKT